MPEGNHGWFCECGSAKDKDAKMCDECTRLKFRHPRKDKIIKVKPLVIGKIKFPDEMYSKDCAATRKKANQLKEKRP